MTKIGDIIEGYKIIGSLKDGSQSACAVWKGQHQTSGILVVIKVPGENLEAKVKTSIFDQLQEEGKILSQLRNVSYIVGIVDHQVIHGNPYIIMSYVSKRSLNDLIEENPQGLSLTRVVTYINQAAEALKHAHDMNIINCDVKPEHMLLKVGDEEIVICDFGLAVRLSSGFDQKKKSQLSVLTRLGDYMAPEQKGKEGYHCCASDQFALGLVAYELLYGKLSVNTTPLFTNRGEKRREFLSTQIPSVLERALSTNPKNRYKTIQEFADALAGAVDYESRMAPNKPANPTPVAQGNEGKAPNPLLADPAIIRTSADDPPRRSVAFSRRAFIRHVPLTVIDAITLGVVGASWVELEPKIAQLFAPQIVHPNPPKLFGTIYNIYHGHHFTVNGVTWAPDSKRIASASLDGTVQVWDADNGVSITGFPSIAGTIEPIYDVIWSPTENKVASCSNNADDGTYTINIWDASSGHILFPLKGHKGLIVALAWSPDGKYIASASFDTTVKVWDAHSGSPKPIQTYVGHTALVYDVTWSPDSTRIASCSLKPENEVHVWNALTAHRTQTFAGHTDDVLSVSWIPTQNGNDIASSSTDKTVRIWSAVNAIERTSLQKTFESAVRKVRWSHNGKYLAAGTRPAGTIHVWEAETGIELSLSPYNEKAHDINSTGVDINALAWSPDGTMIASGGNDKLVHVWSSGLADAGKRL